MEPRELIQSHFDETIDVQQAARVEIADAVAAAAEAMTAALLAEHKILACGNGGSAGDAMHIASELINRFEMDRPALPAVALTADTPTLTSIANDSGYEQVFARQVTGLGVSGDVLLAISTSGRSPNVAAAIDAAHHRGVRVIALTGKDGGLIAGMLDPEDIEIRVPSSSTARIQETHLVVIHCLCDLVDRTLFGA
ncbi:MAG: phosphoheptose isomerase [Halofilum sp. (in: g-proteobacteria)]|nr:phosphoheptose isomerase [Halofilum sp. (in: g-proteobacteria)]